MLNTSRKKWNVGENETVIVLKVIWDGREKLEHHPSFLPYDAEIVLLRATVQARATSW